MLLVADGLVLAVRASLRNQALGGWLAKLVGCLWTSALIQRHKVEWTQEPHHPFHSRWSRVQLGEADLQDWEG